ncbi:TonB-dependent receptor [Oxalobacteraceae bacterium]|nr:TonB-dependent receptor [Oxalobacteraceae bacterium]
MAATHPGARSLAASSSVPNSLTHPRLLAVAVQSALLSLLGAALPPAHAQVQGAAPAAGALTEILVQARRDEVVRSGSTTVVSSNELDKRNSGSMADIARYAPLISVPGAASGSGNIWDGAGNTGFNIRGIEGNRVSLDVDGISLPDAAPKPDGTTLAGFGVARDYFDPETFREVRIGSGSSPAGAGTPGLGGSVAFVTKSPEDYLNDSRRFYADYKFGYLSATGNRMHALTGAAAVGELKALAVLVHRDGHEADSKGSVVPNPDDWRSDALLSKFSWAIGRGQKLGLTIDAYDAKHERAFINKQGALYPEGATQDSHTKRTRYSLEHQLTQGSGWFDTLDSRVYTQDSEVVDQTHASYVSGNQPYLRDIETGFYNKSLGLGADAIKALGADATLSYGFNWETQETRRPWREDRTVVKTGAHQITNKNRMADADTDKLAAYLRGEFGFALAGYRAVLTPGLRVEQRKFSPKNLSNYVVAVPSASAELKKESDFFATPSLNLSVDLTPAINVYAQYSRGTRLPTAGERTGTYDSFSYTGAGNGYAVLGNSDLKKETSNAFELGLKGTPANGLELSAALFYTGYNNFIEYAAQPADPVNYPTISQGMFRPENVGKVKTWGAELSSRYALAHLASALKGFSVAATVGLMHSRAENTLTGKTSELASTLPVKGSLTLAWDDAQARFGAALATTVIRGKRSEADVISGVTAERFKIPGSATMDVNAYWNLGKNVVLQAGIFNLTDRKYWDYASSRALAAATSAATLADIERQARPGRNYSATLKLVY